MSHQIDESAFRGVLPEDIEWKPFPAFPPSARLAVVVGDPTEPGPYVIRVKLPAGVKLMPHVHPEDRVYTVISGVFYIGLGEHFDSEVGGIPARYRHRSPRLDGSFSLGAVR
jgi:hypothetical protein